MSAFPPPFAQGVEPDPPRQEHVDPLLDVEERRRRWEVRAAHWRAHALAEEVFGAGVRTSLEGLRTGGDLRGLLRLEVGFRTLDAHRRAEARFLSAAGGDPLLSTVPLLYVVGPREG